MWHRLRLSVPLLCVLGMICVVARPAAAQSFTVDTTVTPVGDLNAYDFVLSYVQAVGGQSLGTPIWKWTFFVDPDTPVPSSILSPLGWLYAYDAASGEFDWYTEGPGGAASGDFGDNVLQPGQNLSGFSLQTPLEPGLSVAFAYDTQQNIDLNFATIPAFAPVTVPEPSGLVVALSCATCLLVMTRHRRSRSRSAV